MSILEKVKFLNSWLRYHSDYRITIDLYDIYACLVVRIFHKKEQVAIDWGNTLEHRLDYAIDWISKHEYQ